MFIKKSQQLTGYAVNEIRYTIDITRNNSIFTTDNNQFPPTSSVKLLLEGRSFDELSPQIRNRSMYHVARCLELVSYLLLLIFLFGNARLLNIFGSGI